jgi:hypothetical protein
MSITYTNFRGDLYYLHSRKTKKGNTTFQFSKKIGGDLVDDLPEGYEVYETPNGKVFLRKVLKKSIHPEEIKIIEDGVKNHCSIKKFKLDITKDMVYIYTPIDIPFPNVGTLTLDKHLDYETVMRFRLLDEDERNFMVERYCFIGGIDDWIELESSKSLEELAEEYVPHIGQESIYDLF